jgi:pimeloyl-ACP methyl ester carboxylesterase
MNGRQLVTLPNSCVPETRGVEREKYFQANNKTGKQNMLKKSSPIAMAAFTTVLLILVFVASLAHAQVRRDVVADLPRNAFHFHSVAAVSMAAKSLAAAGRLATPLAAIAAALPANVTTVPCPEGNSVCGYVQVPLDRKHPQGTKIGIYFEQYLHSNPGPAVSAIMANLGGPGIGTAANYRDYFQFRLFAANMDAHDLLLVDDRGRGMSETIDCPELQHGGTDFATAQKDCAAQLGAAASRFGTGDIAEDMNDVRAALGYDLIDYLGASWGGDDAIAFATRHPEHVRSLVLDSPHGPPVLNPYTSRLHFQANSLPPVISNLCSRSLLCAPDHLHPAEELSQLIETVRAHPVEGDSHDGSGNLLHVKVDETALLDFVLRGKYITKNEALAAYESLVRGDAAPLLRLAAEGFYTLDPRESGDPSDFSQGAYFATGCSDEGEPWGWEDPVSDRMEAYSRYITALPSNYFEPFSKAVGRDTLFSALGKQCFWWQKPTPSAPVVKPHVVYPSVPTLVLAGDIDVVVPLAANKAVAALFPSSNFVTIANARHETTGWTQCGVNLANQMIETLSPGDTTCANTPEYIWPAVGRFPLFARDARAATIDPMGGNQIGLSERKVVSVAVATAVDALQRSLIGSGTGVGLRGGIFQTSDYVNYTLSNCAFSQDLAVSGTIVWSYDSSVTADLTVSGTGTAGGTLHFAGSWQRYGPVGYFQVKGTLGGRNVAVLVPEG